MIVAAAGYNHPDRAAGGDAATGWGRNLPLGRHQEAPYFYLDFGKDSGIRAKEAPWNMQLAMAMAAFLFVSCSACTRRLSTACSLATEYQPYYAYYIYQKPSSSSALPA